MIRQSWRQLQDEIQTWDGAGSSSYLDLFGITIRSCFLTVSSSVISPILGIISNPAFRFTIQSDSIYKTKLESK